MNEISGIGFRPFVKSNILHILVDGQALWLATQWNGLYQVDRVSGQIRHYAHQPKNPASLSNNKLLCVFANPFDSHMLWIGTHGGGLCHFDKRTGRCRRFNQLNGLPNNVVYAAIPDQRGNVWITTNQGLCRLDRRTFQTRAYTHEDGLLADEFNRFHFLHLPGPVRRSDGTAGIPNHRQSDHDDRIVLGGLEGINEDWILTERAEAIYTNLSPGTYTLKLNASNTSGIWSPQVRTLSVIIHPPLWATWWAYGLYALLLGGIAYSLFRAYLNRIHWRQLVTLKQQEAQQLKVVDDMKTRFFANITHEFRTPLTLILTPTAQLKEYVHEPENLPQNLRRLETIDRNAHQLLRLVNQLLDLSKLEANALPVDEAWGDLVQFIGQIVTSFESQAEAKSIQLTFRSVGMPPAYWFDTDKLERIVTNLVSNALKFTADRNGAPDASPMGGKIAINLTPLGDGVQLTVTDTGIGILSDKLPHIFDRFYQVDDSSTKQQEGTGIGLALVKELVDLQGGKIGVESQFGQGTTFTVELPYRIASFIPEVAGSSDRPPDERPQPNGLDERSGEAPVVLLVEDNAELSQYIASSLPPSYQLYRAAHGADGWEQALNHVPDLIISDVLMPVMDGYTLCQKLKADVRTSHIPVILLTAKSAYNSRLAGLSLGADDYIAKPFYVAELQLRVRNLLEQRRQYREWIRASLTQLEGASTGGAAPQTPDPFLDSLYELLEKHLDDSSFGADDLTTHARMSRMSLHRKLKAVAGLSAGELIRTYRLKRATQFLTQGLNSSETAYRVGFDSPAYFTKCFRETYQMTPTEFASSQSR